MGRLLILYDVKEEDLAGKLREFFLALGTESVLMFPEEPGANLSSEEKEGAAVTNAFF